MWTLEAIVVATEIVVAVDTVEAEEAPMVDAEELGAMSAVSMVT